MKDSIWLGIITVWAVLFTAIICANGIADKCHRDDIMDGVFGQKAIIVRLERDLAAARDAAALYQVNSLMHQINSK